ncbi:E3 ubiquitin-protein ligase [Salix suchowensis]|nr:E3 ubiquitin-protein ligase [Salix suchowensis]
MKAYFPKQPSVLRQESAPYVKSKYPYASSRNIPSLRAKETRRSAARARKSMSAMNTRSSATADILEETCKAIQIIKRHRKRRHAKLREMTREDEEGRTKAVQSSGIPVPGDQDVVEAHVDACLASEARRIDVEQQDEAGPSHPTDWGGNDSRIGNVSGLRGIDYLLPVAIIYPYLLGAGFNIRNHTQKDVDDEVDIDGDDEAVFGTAQFTERDIMRIDAVRMEEEESGDEDVDIGGPWERQRSTSSMQAREQATNTPEDGIITVNIFSVTAMSHMPGSIHGANCFNRMLAYVLPRMLVTLSRINKALPNLQADYYCY